VIEHVRAELLKAAKEDQYTLVVAFTVPHDLMVAPEGRRRVAAHAAAAAGRAFDQLDREDAAVVAVVPS
jgi:hypothetical protein